MRLCPACPSPALLPGAVRACSPCPTGEAAELVLLLCLAVLAGHGTGELFPSGCEVLESPRVLRRSAGLGARCLLLPAVEELLMLAGAAGCFGRSHSSPYSPWPQPNTRCVLLQRPLPAAAVLQPCCCGVVCRGRTRCPVGYGGCAEGTVPLALCTGGIWAAAGLERQRAAGLPSMLVLAPRLGGCPVTGSVFSCRGRSLWEQGTGR